MAHRWFVFLQVVCLSAAFQWCALWQLYSHFAALCWQETQGFQAVASCCCNLVDRRREAAYNAYVCGGCLNPSKFCSGAFSEVFL